MSSLKGVTIPAILSEIRSHRKLVAFWNGRDFSGIAADHAASIRDLQIMLAMVRFPDMRVSAKFAPEFSPVVIFEPDNGPEVSDSDRRAFIDAMMDNANSADDNATDTSELVSA